MDTVRDMLESWNYYLNQMPDLLYAVLIFIVGWLVARIISRIVKGLLSKTKWDDKLFEYINVSSKFQSEVVISKIVFYILMIFVLIMFFDVLNLHFVAEPIINMMNVMIGSVPNILKAGLILLLGWLLATILKIMIQKGGQKLGVHKLLAKWKVIEGEQDAEKALTAAGRIVFYLVMLLFLPGVLGALNIGAVSNPLSNMLSQFLQFLPQLFGALLTLLIGWLVAKIVREIVTNFLQSIGVEKLSARFGLDKVFAQTNISSVIGTIIYVLILIPTFIASLETLDLNGISDPAITMLTSILSMLPQVAIAIVLIFVGVWLGRIVGNMATGLLEKLGFNSILKTLGLGKMEPSENTMTMSQIVGRIVQVVIILLFAVEALQIVKLQVLVTMLSGLLAYLPNVLVAIIIVGAGLFIGNWAARILSSIVVKSQYKILVSIAKYAIITVSLFMALDQLHVASSIVNTAFTLILGGLALAFGLAFGLGGKDAAAKWLAQWQKENEE